MSDTLIGRNDKAEAARAPRHGNRCGTLRGTAGAGMSASSAVAAEGCSRLGMLGGTLEEKR
jgi:hypothetical protein